MIFDKKSLNTLDQDIKNLLVKLSNRYEVLDSVSTKTDHLFGIGPKLLGGIFTAFERMPYFRGALAAGKFSSFSSILIEQAKSSLAREGNIELMPLVMNRELNHFECLYRVLLHNCNPYVQLGRREGTTAIRARFIDDTYPNILDETTDIGRDVSKEINDMANIIDIAMKDIGSFYWEDKNFQSLIENYNNLQNKKADLKIMYRMVSKTFRNRKEKIRSSGSGIY